MGRALTVPDVEDDLMDKLTRRAERHGRSVEDEVLGILVGSVAGEPAEDFWTRATRLRAETVGRPQTPSEVLQREGRDGR